MGGRGKRALVKVRDQLRALEPVLSEELSAAPATQAAQAIVAAPRAVLGEAETEAVGTAATAAFFAADRRNAEEAVAGIRPLVKKPMQASDRVLEDFHCLWVFDELADRVAVLLLPPAHHRRHEAVTQSAQRLRSKGKLATGCSRMLTPGQPSQSRFRRRTRRPSP